MSWFPELELFEDRQQRREAMARARQMVFDQVGRKPSYVRYLLTWMAVLGLLISVLCFFGRPRMWAFGLIPLVAGGAGALAVEYIFRQQIREHLRRQLNDRGIRVCMRCGYNLAGNASGRCPECGTDA